jgi:hypothetical protein
VRWQGRTRGAIGSYLIFLFLFLSRKKEKKYYTKEKERCVFLSTGSIQRKTFNSFSIQHEVFNALAFNYLQRLIILNYDLNDYLMDYDILIQRFNFQHKVFNALAFNALAFNTKYSTLSIQPIFNV